MARRRRRSLLVPEARDAMEQLKLQIIREKVQTGDRQFRTQKSPSVGDLARSMGIPFRPNDNGDITTREAGKIGGQIGGSMVKRLIALAEQQLSDHQTGRMN